MTEKYVLIWSKLMTKYDPIRKEIDDIMVLHHHIPESIKKDGLTTHSSLRTERSKEDITLEDSQVNTRYGFTFVLLF